MTLYPRNFFVLVLLMPTLIWFLSLYLAIVLFDISNFHWYLSVDVSEKILWDSFLKHTILLAFILFTPSSISLNLNKASTWKMFILGVVLLLYILIASSYVKIVLLSLCIYLIFTSRISTAIYIILVAAAFINIYLLGSRYMMAFPIMLYVIMNRHGVMRVFLLGLTSILIFVFVLTPLRHGVPIYSFIVDNGYIYFFEHFASVAASMSFHAANELSLYQSLAEAIPLGKSLLGAPGVIDSTRDIFVVLGIDGDFGSNSSASPIALVLVYSLVVIYFFRLRRYSIFVIGYFCFYAPYFLRRSIENFINDVLVMIAVLFIIKCLYMLAKYSSFHKFKDYLQA